jgi:hypothetical protein
MKKIHIYIVNIYIYIVKIDTYVVMTKGIETDVGKIKQGYKKAVGKPLLAHYIRGA